MKKLLFLFLVVCVFIFSGCTTSIIKSKNEKNIDIIVENNLDKSMVDIKKSTSMLTQTALNNMKNNLSEFYAITFSEEELQELADFYSSQEVKELMKRISVEQNSLDLSQKLVNIAKEKLSKNTLKKLSSKQFLNEINRIVTLSVPVEVYE